MDKERWQELSLSEQIGNIGAEISRARHWEEKDDNESRDKALQRAFELLSLTLADKRWHLRLRELARLYEILCDVFTGASVYNTHLQMLENYLLPFAFAARRGK